ncbi:hypothetical protein L208DRAFT_1379040 [Tricholoma matsutake]|nr:hypothetical protein L208DRAFT_1379040 [Tricholoma matsutake 945]
MSEPNNKAKQAAATRALNQLQQEEANKRLIESTHGLVEEAETELGVTTKKEKTKPNLKSALYIHVYPSSKSTTSKSTSTKAQWLVAAQIDSDSSEEQEVILPPKARSKCTAHVEDKDKEESDQQSGSADGTEDSQSLDMDEDDLQGLDSTTLHKVLADEEPTILEPDAESSALLLFDENFHTDDAQAGECTSQCSSMSSHYSVPPMTDSDCDVAIPEDNDSNKLEIKPKVKSVNQSQCGKVFLTEHQGEHYAKGQEGKKVNGCNYQF